MSNWLPSTGKIYLPPTKPVPKILHTDEFVTPTNIFFHAGSERLITVGHPYFEVKSVEGVIEVPKVSGNQFRVFQVLLPDPNKFALIDTNIYDSENERLVWRLRGLEITRGGPLGIGTSGHPLFNKLNDTENPNRLVPQAEADSRVNVSVDPKQTQLFIVGCTPPVGTHWDKAKPCDTANQNGKCPPIELVHSVIQDGDMCDTGFGNMNFAVLQEDKSGVPLDIVASTCKWPDFTKMTKDAYGNSLFFFGKREQLFTRHLFTRNGNTGDAIPNGEKHEYYLVGGSEPTNKAAPSTYFGVPSGSLVSSDANLFNRPLWIQRAQGMNNGVCWGNNVFITLVDNTHNTNFHITVNSNGETPQTYKPADFRTFLRHTEMYEFELIVQLCKVKLTPEVLGYINVMDPNIVEEWNISFLPPPQGSLEDSYRYLASLATRCPIPEVPKEKSEPYKDLNLWKVDLKDRLSSELSQHSLGRRFLYQVGTSNGINGPLKRMRTSGSSSTARSSTAKKRKKTTN
ncbi:L1 protein [Vulpes vulpes papillomavirus 1]|uniref:Major capsid protein L1 n=1 Tax=Vulpes vulpes papillomavirus 1 TaxID=1163709 RepID=A0A0A7BVN0_9PAPI|nr:L1 protein [Vulpes vulpes papillomavirus 1]AHM27271.1 L1 protein [Vulpes vulpes papillomavirus 1]